MITLIAFIGSIGLFGLALCAAAKRGDQIMQEGEDAIHQAARADARPTTQLSKEAA